MTIFFTEISFSDANMQEIQALYEASFPSDERRDFCVFLELLKNDNRFRVRIGTDGECGRFLCFISYWNFGDFCYIEHFAVEPELRGHGIGKAAMRDFFQSAGKRVILEVEPPADDITRRRIALYESLGYVLWSDYRYIQPPYAPHLNALELKLMTYGKFSSTDINRAVSTIHSEVYGVADGAYRLPL